jgi:GT2 family glycosyltransferase
MITTRNREVDLRRTCRVLRTLNPPPLEILITADGCTDGTVQVVGAELPNAKLTVNRTGQGSVASRNRMMREAVGDLVLSLDDDSYPEQLDCIARVVPLFQKNSKLAVLHFPQRTDEHQETLSQTSFNPARATRSFASASAVLRRSIYLQLPGYEPRFFHMYEEPDYALQCIAFGYEVQYNPIVTIRHHFSRQSRNEISTHRWHSRNELWSTLMRCPLPQMPLVIGYRILSQFRYSWKRGLRWVVQEPRWWLEALAGIPYFLRKRKPVSWQRYKAWLALT